MVRMGKAHLQSIWKQVLGKKISSSRLPRILPNLGEVPELLSNLTFKLLTGKIANTYSKKRRPPNSLG